MAEQTDVYQPHGFWGQRPEIKYAAPEDFVIMPWGWTPGDEKALREIKECGFNLAGFMAPEYVKVARKAGLKCIVDDYRVSNAVNNIDISDAEITRLLHQAVAPFKGNSTVFGYYFKDEPGNGHFAALARWKNALTKEDPSALAYINMFPVGASETGFQFYDEYATAVKPTYLSYDHYCLLDDGSMGTSFYSNLETMRKLALKHNIPFWNIILANSHFHYADATVGGLSVQVYSTLAYGGRGISYFTYFAPLFGNYRNAAVDQFLNKTPTWDIIQRLNLQIHQLAPTYLKLKSVNVFHHPNVPALCSGIDTAKYVAEVSGGDFLVGEFMGPNATPYVMLVNKDIRKSTSFGVKFKKEGQVMMTNAYTGLTTPLAGENGWLGPGQGVLLSLSK